MHHPERMVEHVKNAFGYEGKTCVVAGLSGAKTDYMTTFNCDYTSNWYTTETYLKKRMTAGGSIATKKNNA